MISIGDNPMKAIALIPILAAGIILSGCKTQQSTVAVDYDDAYATTPARSSVKVPIQSSAEQTVAVDPSGTANPPSATSGNDYSEYNYSERIQKFHNADPDSPYYDSTSITNYSDGGSSPDINLSFGLGFGYGAGYMGFGYGYDPWYWGYPYYSYGWYPYGWYNPWAWYYPYYWPYYSYGYWDGYWNGYWDGYYGYPPYYEYPTNTYYYGKRTFSSSGSTGTGTLKRTTENDAITANRVAPSTPSAQQKYQYTRPSNERQTPVIRQNPQTQQVQREKATPQVQRQSPAQPTPKYTRENATPQVERQNSQQYTSPAYRQPKSSQEYVNPRTTPGSTIRETQEPVRQQNYSTPPKSTTPRSNYSTPSRSSSSPSYSSPSRSSSSPARSNSSYSSPSRSNSSYSTPSRSSSSSPSYSPSRSSGSSSGGGSSSSPRSGGGGFGGRR